MKTGSAALQLQLQNAGSQQLQSLAKLRINYAEPASKQGLRAGFVIIAAGSSSEC